MLTEICSTINKLLKADECDKNTFNVMLGAFCVMCLVVQLDTQHLLLAVIGAGTYALLQMKLRREHKQSKKLCSIYNDPHSSQYPTWRSNGGGSKKLHKQEQVQKEMPKAVVAPTFAPPTLTASAMPLSAPVFQARGWDAEVAELLTQLKPTKASEEAVQKLLGVAKKALRSIIPQAEVFGFAIGDISRGTAFGVAVPEVDILVRCNPEMLLRCLQVRLQKHVQVGPAKMIDERKVQKSAIRACTDVLCSAGFKFRRSAFRGGEPKVTLLAPSTLGISDKAVPVDFSVNTITPVYNSALMTVASALDTRVLELALLVKRWAKDRGVCHAAKGHLPPYAWNLLTVYFLQSLGSKDDKDGLLPPFDDFDWSSCPIGNKRACISEKPRESWSTSEEFANLKAPELFKEFFRFYRYTVNWSEEGVSLHHPRKGALRKVTALVIQPPVVNDASIYTPELSFGNPPHTALVVEDPWEPTRNLSADLTYFGVLRMKEELCRACNLCAENASLSELLQPWVPPERPDGKGSDDESPEGAKPVQRIAAQTTAQPEKKGTELLLSELKARDALGAALFAELKARGEEQARKATEQLLSELHAESSPGGREKKTQQLLSLLKDDNKLSNMISSKPLL